MPDKITHVLLVITAVYNQSVPQVVTWGHNCVLQVITDVVAPLVITVLE